MATGIGVSILFPKFEKNEKLLNSLRGREHVKSIQAYIGGESFSAVLDENAPIAHIAKSVPGFLSVSIRVPILNESISADEIAEKFKKAKKTDFGSGGPELHKSMSKIWTPSIGTDTNMNYIGVNSIEGDRRIKSFFIVGNVSPEKLASEIASLDPKITVKEFVNSRDYAKSIELAFLNARRMVSYFAEKLGLSIEEGTDHTSFEDIHTNIQAPNYATGEIVEHLTNYVTKNDRDEYIQHYNSTDGSKASSGIIFKKDATAGSIYFPPALKHANRSGCKNSPPFSNDHGNSIPTAIGLNPDFDAEKDRLTSEAVNVEQIISSDLFFWKGKSKETIKARISTVPKYNVDSDHQIQQFLKTITGLNDSVELKNLEYVVAILSQ